MEFLAPSNVKVVSFVRRQWDDVILCVGNLARTVQPAELDLSAFAGLVPMEMLGYTEFPTIGTTPYFLDARALWLLLVRTQRAGG